jgi:outer membrane protein assembly factor BamB
MNRLTAACVLLLLAPRASADDWPQWMGPGRDNVWRETGLIERFPEGGPRVVWRAPLASGYAGPAVAEGRVFVMDLVTSDDVKISNFERKPFAGIERVLAIDEKTGQEIWKHEYPVEYAISYPDGPRCTPIVADGKVYALGAVGKLTCLDAATGDVVWEKDLPAEYDTKPALWGYANHPLLDGDNLICIVGGEGSHAVAFNKNTGEEVWRALSSPEQGYSPPTIVEAAGVRQLILVKPDAIVAVNPADGAEFWSMPYSADNLCVVMSPVAADGHLFAGGFNNKSVLLKLADDKPGAEVVWHDKGKDALAPINTQPFAADGVMYGVDQRGVLRAIDLVAGKQLWETSKPWGERPLRSGTAFLVPQGDRLWMLVDTGELIIARVSRDGFDEIDRAKVIEPTAVAEGRDVLWSMPAFANRRAYIRNDKEIICLDLAAESGPAASQ